MAMQTTTLHRSYQVSGIIAAILLALLLLGTETGRNALAWVYLQSTDAISRATHFHGSPPGQVVPDLPAMHVVQPNRRRLYEDHTD